LDARKLLVENLDLIERVIRFTSRRQRLDESEAEEFASIVKLKLVENDYAIVRKFAGRSQFATFITTVVQRMLLDYRIHQWGKWHASAEAKRLGDLAVELELLLHRDGRTIDDALPLLQDRHPEATREGLEHLAARLPERRARRRMVDLSEAESVAVEAETEEHILNAERQRTCLRLSSAMRKVIARLAENDRLLLQLRFECRLTVAQIARSMHVEQKLLYRRIEKLMRDLRAELERAGIDPSAAADLIGREGTQLDFALGSPVMRPSNGSEGSVAAQGEVSR
jgi:RNA polymerase sigma factor for flagellar operon FliA